MATNPKFPEPQEREQQKRGPALVQKPEAPRSAVPGVVLAIITAILLLGAIFYFMPRTPKRAVPPSAAEVPAQPVAGQIQLSNVTMATDPTGKSVTLDAQLTNAGQQTVTGLMAEVSFTLSDGRTVAVNAPVSAIAVQRGAKDTNARTGETVNLVNDPIKPGEQRAARVTVPQVPQGWNHTLPGVRVVTVTGTTAGK